LDREKKLGRVSPGRRRKAHLPVVSKKEPKAATMRTREKKGSACYMHERKKKTSYVTSRRKNTLSVHDHYPLERKPLLLLRPVCALKKGCTQRRAGAEEPKHEEVEASREKRQQHQLIRRERPLPPYAGRKRL